MTHLLEYWIGFYQRNEYTVYLNSCESRYGAWHLHSEQFIDDLAVLLEKCNVIYTRYGKGITIFIDIDKTNNRYYLRVDEWKIDGRRIAQRRGKVLWDIKRAISGACKLGDSLRQLPTPIINEIKPILIYLQACDNLDILFRQLAGFFPFETSIQQDINMTAAHFAYWMKVIQGVEFNYLDYEEKRREQSLRDIAFIDELGALFKKNRIWHRKYPDMFMIAIYIDEIDRKGKWYFLYVDKWKISGRRIVQQRSEVLHDIQKAISDGQIGLVLNQLPFPIGKRIEFMLIHLRICDNLHALFQKITSQ